MRSTRDLVASIAFSTVLSIVFCAICACCKANSVHGIFSGELVVFSSVGFPVGNSPEDSPAITDIFSFYRVQSFGGFLFFPYISFSFKSGRDGSLMRVNCWWVGST